MAHASAVRVAPRRTPARRTRSASGRRRGHSIRRVVGVLLAIPLALRLLLLGVVIVALWWALNWAYQVARKPTEVFFPVSGSLLRRRRRPGGSTARSSRALHGGHHAGTAGRTGPGRGQRQPGGADLLAVATQSWNPFELYRPASSAVGMFQITDGTFAEARRYCIHDHVVVEDGPWHDPRSCWFNRSTCAWCPATRWR